MIALTAARAFLGAHWKIIAGGVVLAAFAVLLMLYKAEQRRNAKLQDQLVKCSEGRVADRARTEQAQKDAAALNKAEVARIETKSQEITNDVSQDYASDLARLRAELGRVRSKTDAASVRPTGSSQTSTNGKAPIRADDSAQVCLSPGLVLHGAETELQLDALITWVEEQGKVAR